MIATLSLMSCVLAAAQPGDHSEWLLLPQLGRAQEFVYRGSYEEKAAGSDLEYERKYGLRAAVFVLDASPRGAEAAFVTVLRPRNARGGRIEDAGPSSAHLDVIKVDPQGKLTSAGGSSLAVPLEGDGDPVGGVGAGAALWIDVDDLQPGGAGGRLLDAAACGVARPQHGQEGGLGAARRGVED